MNEWQQWLAGLRLWVATFVSSLVILTGVWLISLVAIKLELSIGEFSGSAWYVLVNIGLYIVIVPILNYKIARFFGIDTVERIR